MTFAKNPRIAYRIIDGEGFLVDARTHTLHHLNPVGADLWSWIDGQKNERDFADLLARRYDITPAQALEDALCFMGELKNHDLVVEPAL